MSQRKKSFIDIIIIIIIKYFNVDFVHLYLSFINLYHGPTVILLFWINEK